MLHYQTIAFTPFQQNCSLVWDGATHTAAVIDPRRAPCEIRAKSATLIYGR